MSSAPPGPEPLRRWERIALGIAAVFLVLFGVVVTLRGAYSQRRMTDFGVYARAAWAARTGQDIYAVTDDNFWHYCYPPAFAVLMAPLADPGPGADRAGYIPYGLGVALWYAFGVACAAFAADRLARAVLPDAPRGSRRWWYARTVPIHACVGGLGYTLARGQVNVLVVALIAGSFAAAAAGRRVGSGLWLAAAVALKVIPGYLLLFPLLRRDGRALAGAAAGAVLFFGLVPAAVWGPRGAIDNNLKVFDSVLRPSTTGGGDQTRAVELTNTTSTDSQSFVAAIHAHLYPDPAARPAMASPETKLAHWGIGAALTLLSIAVALRRPIAAPADALVFLGCLCVLMMLLTPVSHMHYYAMAFPLVAGLWLKGMAARPGAIGADRATTAAIFAWGLATALPLFHEPLLDRLREAGFGTAASLALWAFALHRLGRTPTPATPTAPRRPGLASGLVLGATCGPTR